MSHGGPAAESIRTPTRVLALLVVALVAAACRGQPVDGCIEVPLAPGLERARAEAISALDFEPTTLCGHRSDLLVVRVFASTALGDGPQPRLNSIVERDRERGFIFSETRAVMPFTAIPRGTHWLTVSAGGITASGFAGPSGSGDDIAYLRWRADGVTRELAVTLRSWLDEGDVATIAIALIEAGGSSAGDERRPVSD